MANRGASAVSKYLEEYTSCLTKLPAWQDGDVRDSDEKVVLLHNWDEVKRTMWDYVGIVRTSKRLQRARHRADMLIQEIAEYYSNYKISKDLLELRNLIVIADLIIRSAENRKESRGLHHILDYPDLLPEAVDTVLVPDNAAKR